MMINIIVGWIAIFVGIVTGIITGLYFHKEHFLDGYCSWTRRLMRLGHVSFFGLGFINLFFALTARNLGIESGLEVSSILMVIGVITMPLICYLAAFLKVLRHLFFIPVLSMLVAVVLFLWKLYQI